MYIGRFRWLFGAILRHFKGVNWTLELFTLPKWTGRYIYSIYIIFICYQLVILNDFVYITYCSHTHADVIIGGVLSASAFSDAVSIAFIGILETLISARMADEMNGQTHHDRNKEVYGLGVANIVGGSE